MFKNLQALLCIRYGNCNHCQHDMLPPKAASEPSRAELCRTPVDVHVPCMHLMPFDAMMAIFGCLRIASIEQIHHHVLTALLMGVRTIVSKLNT